MDNIKIESVWLDADLFDAEGFSRRTYDDVECEDTMGEVFREETDEEDLSNLTEDDKKLLTEYAPKLFNTFVHSKDKERFQELKEIMFRLCELLNAYRLDGISKLNSGSEQYAEIRAVKKEGKAKRAETLRKNAINMLKILDGSRLISTRTIEKKELQNITREMPEEEREEAKEYRAKVLREHSNNLLEAHKVKEDENVNHPERLELLNILLQVIDYPKTFTPTVSEINPRTKYLNLKDIENYLKDLNLIGKYTPTKEFCKKI